jgi:hypothetical protein
MPSDRVYLPVAARQQWNGQNGQRAAGRGALEGEHRRTKYDVGKLHRRHFATARCNEARCGEGRSKLLLKHTVDPIPAEDRQRAPTEGYGKVFKLLEQRFE